MHALFDLIKRSKIVISIIVLLIFGYLLYFFLTSSTTTDNAYVVANIQPVAAEVSGKVEDVYVHNDEWVKKGTLLFSIDAKVYEINLKQAELNVKEVVLQQTEVESLIVAFKQRDLLQQDMSKLAQLQSVLAKTRLQQAEAKLKLEIAQSQLAATKIYAPEDGVVSNLFLVAGTLIKAYQPLFAFIDTRQWWVQANFKETDLANIKKGSRAKIRLKMYLGQKIYTGIVENSHWAVGRRVPASTDLLQQVPQENQWLLLAQRFPVLIKIENPDSNYPLHVGASAYVTIETSN